jgi:D-3-phosphoglycerate dehydrogenase
MDNIKVLVINDEGGDIQLEKEVISNSLSGRADELTLMYISAGDTETIEKELPEAHGVISVYNVFDRKTLERMKKCRIIATQTIGINTIDLDAAAELGICITNVPDYCIEEVALHTVTLAMACVRKITVYDKLARNKKWGIDDIYKQGKVHRLQGRTYGLVSFGNIAKRVAELMKGFGMKVLAYDPFLNESVFKEHDVQKVDSLEELFSSCNIVSLHTPLTPKTEGMIDLEIFKKMPEKGILINTSRGEIVKEGDLYKALKEGILGAAGVDVIVDESEFGSSLYELENVIVTPHVAYYSEEALTECRRKAAEQIGDVIGRGRMPKYLVNKSVKGKTKTALIS